MSMSITHYFGYYFKCEKRDDVDQEELFPDESMWRVYDENGSKQINDFHIYIPNKECKGCFTLDEDSETGLLGFDEDDKSDVPEFIHKADTILSSRYKEIEMRYGIVSFCH